jgi:hypothetical protein
MIFLYLPDAVSLLLLGVALLLLRKSAVEHLRMELDRLRSQTLDVWRASGASLEDSRYVGLQNLIDSSDRLAEKLSPARLYFVHRCWRKIVKSQHEGLFPYPLGEFERRLTTINDKRILETLAGLKLDLVMKLGVFLVAGSISGWISLFYLESRIIWRSRIWPAGNRVDRFMDFNERLVTRMGREAHRLAILIDPLAVR